VAEFKYLGRNILYQHFVYVASQRSLYLRSQNVNILELLTFYWYKMVQCINLEVCAKWNILQRADFLS